MKSELKGDRKVAYVELDAGDKIHTLQGKRKVRVSLVVPADERLRAELLPASFAEGGLKEMVHPEEKKPLKDMTLMKAAMLEFLRGQSEPLSAQQIADHPDITEAFARPISRGVAYEVIAALVRDGLAVKHDVLTETPHPNQTYRTKAALWSAK